MLRRAVKAIPGVEDSTAQNRKLLIVIQCRLNINSEKAISSHYTSGSKWQMSCTTNVSITFWTVKYWKQEVRIVKFSEVTAYLLAANNVVKVIFSTNIFSWLSSSNCYMAQTRNYSNNSFFLDMSRVPWSYLQHQLMSYTNILITDKFLPKLDIMWSEFWFSGVILYGKFLIISMLVRHAGAVLSAFSNVNYIWVSTVYQWYPDIFYRCYMIYCNRARKHPPKISQVLKWQKNIC